jgi:hypothetical protein
MHVVIYAHRHVSVTVFRAWAVLGQISLFWGLVRFFINFLLRACLPAHFQAWAFLGYISLFRGLARFFNKFYQDVLPAYFRACALPG